MDPILASAWEQAHPPFDGVAVFNASGDEIPLHPLRLLTAAVIRVLEEHFPRASLSILDDWHEHDGFVCPGKSITWARIREHLGSGQEFLFFATGDHQVSKAIYPRSMEFCVRVFIDEDAKPEEGTGWIDATVPASLAGRISELFTAAGIPPGSEPAKAYFDRRFGG